MDYFIQLFCQVSAIIVISILALNWILGWIDVTFAYITDKRLGQKFKPCKTMYRLIFFGMFITAIVILIENGRKK